MTADYGGFFGDTAWPSDEALQMQTMYVTMLTVQLEVV